MTGRASFRASIAMLAVQALVGCSASSVTQTKSEFVPLAAPSRTGQALLYVSEPALRSVAIYTYPGLRARATLRGLGFVQGMCVDASTGNVWIVQDQRGNKVVEFPHGGTTPIRSVKVPYGFYTDSCSVSPTTGDLAVAAVLENDDAGALLIYHGARGTPVIHQTGKMFYYDFVGYDASGNAFVDGNGSYGFKLAELPAGGKSLEIVGPKGLVNHRPGNVQYDGANVAVGAEKGGLIYQISGGVVTGRTKLNGTCFFQQFYIDGGQVVVPNTCDKMGEVLIYNYPSGGVPLKKITGLSYPFGVVVSR